VARLTTRDYKSNQRRGLPVRGVREFA